MADEQLAALMAQQGPRALDNPVIRYALGLPSGGGAGYQQPARGAPPPPPKELPPAGKKASPRDALLDKLYARMITSRDAGFAAPGPGVLPGASLRPEVQKTFADMGGVAGIDVTNLTPEEERMLGVLIDPAWLARHQ